MTHSADHAGPFALGTFRAGSAEFAGLVVGQAVYPIDDAAGLHRPSVRQLLEHWVAVRPELDRIAASGAAPFMLAELDVLAPVQPRQIFQSGANYRTHVMDLAVAARKPGDTRSDDEVRGEIGRLQDERAATGDPYVFTGAVSALCGAYDDVILPMGTEKNDFELELAAVIGIAAAGQTLVILMGLGSSLRSITPNYMVEDLPGVLRGIREHKQAGDKLVVAAPASFAFNYYRKSCGVDGLPTTQLRMPPQQVAEELGVHPPTDASRHWLVFSHCTPSQIAALESRFSPTCERVDALSLDGASASCWKSRPQ